MLMLRVKSSSVIFLSPLSTIHMRAVCFDSLDALTSAPHSKRSSTSLLFLVRHASIRGVLPVPFLELTLTPERRQDRTSLRSPRMQALSNVFEVGGGGGILSLLCSCRREPMWEKQARG